MAQKAQKYDRQLRIWGEHGQAALETARICLLNCGPTGTEALKNLVLGGVGSFTIVDGTRLEASDLGNNYFVDWDSLGQSKVKCASTLVQELNESVSASFVEESPEVLLETNPSFFSGFTIVIATQMSESALIKLDEICRKHNVRLLMVRSYGLVGCLRISLQEHCVLETKPENDVDDLKLHRPWPELLTHMKSFNIDTMDEFLHKHIPYSIILLKLAEEWKATHGGHLPTTSADKAAFKAAIQARKHCEDEDNFKEALASAYKVWSPPTIGSELRSLLEDRAAREVDATSSDFWIMVAALRDFVANEGDGELPLGGAIPDMHSSTELFVSLQLVYQRKAEADISAVEAHVRRTLKVVGRDPGTISRATVKAFCKNCRYLKVVRYRTLAEEYNSKSGLELSQLLTVEDNSNALLYVLLRAADHFAAIYNRYPGEFDGELEEDTSRLKAVAVSLLHDMGAGSVSPPDDIVSEICRFGAAELHCTASVMGGTTAQEAIKLITHQFVPLPGTLVYNAMTSTSSVLKL